MRKLLGIGIFLLSLAAVASAAQEGDSVLSNHDLVKNSFVVSEISYDLCAQADVDVFELVKDINQAKATAESIHAKINTQRLKLYPDKEIILSITIPEPVMSPSPAGISLVKAIYWWNNANGANHYWWAKYNSTLATMFINDIKYGKYKLYRFIAELD